MAPACSLPTFPGTLVSRGRWLTLWGRTGSAWPRWSSFRSGFCPPPSLYHALWLGSETLMTARCAWSARTLATRFTPPQWHFISPCPSCFSCTTRFTKPPGRALPNTSSSGFPGQRSPTAISLNGMVKLPEGGRGVCNLSRLLKHERKNISIFKREAESSHHPGHHRRGLHRVLAAVFPPLDRQAPFICGIAAASRCGWRGHVCGWAMQTLSSTPLYMPLQLDLRTTYRSLLQCQYRNINRKLSAAGMHEAPKLAERPERPELVP